MWVIATAWVASTPTIDILWWFLLALIVLLLWIRVRWNPLMLLMLGLLWAASVQGWLDWQQQMDGTWVGHTITVDATVAKVQQTALRTRLSLHDVRRSDGASLHGAVWCYLYGKQRLHGIMVGDHLHGALRLHRPRNRHNPGGFDFKHYCRQHHIVLLGAAASPLHITPDATLLATIRQRVRSALHTIEPAPRAVLAALLLADRSQLNDHQWQLFSASGTAHLLAISGLHIGMVAGWGFLMAWWWLTRKEAWIVHLPVRRCALAMGVILAIGYATLAGWSLPTQRAVLMLAAAAIAWWLRSQSHPLNTMLAAVMLIVLLDPQAVTSISLWLSFAAVTALIIWGMQTEPYHGNRWRTALHGLLWVSVIASLATLPLVAGIFGRFPLYSLPANLLLVPLYGLWILPSSLSAALLAIVGWGAGAHGLLLVAATGVAAGQWLLEIFYQLPAGSWWLPHLPLWWLMLVSILLAAAAIVWWKHYRLAALSIMTAALLMLVVWPENDVTQTQWTVWDVGQAAATTVRFPGGKVIAIDAPGKRGSRFNGGSTVANGLRAQGVTHLDVVAVSHLQSDHAGGIASLLRRMNRVDALWLADVPENRNAWQLHDWQRELHRLGGKIYWLARGDTVSIGGHSVHVLWPPRHAHRANANNQSLVLSIALDGKQRMLAMGDSEAPVERQLVQYSINHHDLLLVPHHGSKSSSTLAWVQRVHPSLAIMQTGFNNRFHFPNPTVVQRYRNVGAAIANTANGAITGIANGDLQWQQMHD